MLRHWEQDFKPYIRAVATKTDTAATASEHIAATTSKTHESREQIQQRLLGDLKQQYAALDDQHETASFLLKEIQTQWLPAEFREHKHISMPCHVFAPTRDIRDFFGDLVNYLPKQLLDLQRKQYRDDDSNAPLRVLGVHMTLPNGTAAKAKLVVQVLEALSARSRTLITSIAQMEVLLRCLQDSRCEDTFAIMRSEKLFWVPNVRGEEGNKEAPQEGKFYSVDELVWEDPSMVLDGMPTFPRVLSAYFFPMRSFLVRRFCDSCLRQRFGVQGQPECPKCTDISFSAGQPCSSVRLWASVEEYVGVLKMLQAESDPTTVLDRMRNVLRIFSVSGVGSKHRKFILFRL